MATIEGFRAYARLEEQDESAAICYDAALSFAEYAGIPPMTDCPLYDLFVYGVALYQYENRGFSPAISVNAFTQESWVTRQIAGLKQMLEYGNAAKQTGGGAYGGP